MVKPVKSRSRLKTGSAVLSMKLLGSLKRAFVVSVPYVLSLTVVGLLFGAVVAHALGSPAFQLAEVRILNAGNLTPAQSFAFCDLRPGENLIALDLVGVQQVIKRRHPEFKEVIVRRVLPNRVDVQLRRRTPVAQIDLGRFVQVDRDLVLLPGSSQTPFRNLTIIRGASISASRLGVGSVLTDPQVRKAVKFMEVLLRSEILKKHTLTKIDISDPRNLTFYVDGDIEIRMGHDHIIERLKILAQTVRTLELDRNRVGYIDLRFDDVVVGPRSAS